MPEAEAKLHLKRCVDSGLWVPDASKVEKEEVESVDADAETGAAADADADAGAGSSSTDVKPNISIDDID